MATRKRKRSPTRAAAVPERRPAIPPGAVPVDQAALAPNNSYGAPEFVRRGFYVDVPFVCQSCGAEQVWTATQQKWWYEVAKGFAYSHARLCRPCRRREQARRAEARRVHLEGLARKQGRFPVRKVMPRKS